MIFSGTLPLPPPLRQHTPIHKKKLKTPFRLSCGVPGKARWVTTSIARFDPDVDWPSDLDCSFVWNAALRAYDGATQK